MLPVALGLTLLSALGQHALVASLMARDIGALATLPVRRLELAGKAPSAEAVAPLLAPVRPRAALEAPSTSGRGFLRLSHHASLASLEALPLEMLQLIVDALFAAYAQESAACRGTAKHVSV